MKIWKIDLQGTDIPTWRCRYQRSLPGRIVEYTVQVGYNGHASLDVLSPLKWNMAYKVPLETRYLSEAPTKETLAPHIELLERMAQFLFSDGDPPSDRVTKSAGHRHQRWDVEAYERVEGRCVRYLIAVNEGQGNADASISLWDGSRWEEIWWIPKRDLLCKDAYRENTEASMLSGVPFREDLRLMREQCTQILSPEFSPEPYLVKEYVSQTGYRGIYRVGPYRCNLHIDIYPPHVGSVSVWQDPVFEPQPGYPVTVIDEPIEVPIPKDPNLAGCREARDSLLSQLMTTLF